LQLQSFDPTCRHALGVSGWKLDRLVVSLHFLSSGFTCRHNL
jgi:hypothetical protein